MSFIDICWLIVKICAGIIAFFLILGFAAKKIADRRGRKEEDDKRVSTDD